MKVTLPVILPGPPGFGVIETESTGDAALDSKILEAMRDKVLAMYEADPASISGDAGTGQANEVMQ